MECTSCAGKGIVGSGDFPLTLSGVVTTCEPCSGSGVINEEGEKVIESIPEVVSIEETMVQSEGLE